MSANQLSLSGPQSITDYPLRNQAMLAVGAFALLLLVRFATESGEPEA